MATDFVIDIGTSGVKTVLVDAAGRLASTGYREYALHIPRQGWYEQDPLDWWRGAQAAVREMLGASSQAGEVRAVVAGGGDAVVQSTGTGLIAPGLFGVTIGTGGVVTTALTDCRRNVDGRYQIFCHNEPGQWLAMGVSLTAGGALKWLASVVGGAEREVAADLGCDLYALLDRAAARIEPGAEGLFFMPHLVGQRCPYPDATSRAAFVGLTLEHTKAHLVRSVLEGVAFSVAEIAALMQSELGSPCRELRLTGGAARSALWKQILADVFDREAREMICAPEGAAYGAAMLAGVSCGFWRTLEDASVTLHTSQVTSPSDSTAMRYRAHLALYRQLYPALREAFDGIAGL